MPKKILILGGYGNAGFLIAKLLLQETDVRLVLAGRNLSRARQATDELNREFNTNRVSCLQVDAANKNSLKAALEGVNLVAVASSTIDFVRNVSELALEVGADYLDVQLSSPAKLAVLNSLRQKIETKGRCFITDGGFHPGIPAAMVRYAAAKFDALEVANISAAFQLNWQQLQFSESTIAEFIEEINYFNPLVLKNNKWTKMSAKEFPKFDFGELFGERYSTPMFLEELHSLPVAIPSLKETGFYIAGFNWTIDYLVMPIAFAAFKIFREKAKKPMGKLMIWGLKNFSSPPFGAIFAIASKGFERTTK